ncbi:M10 family metallopeptidase C-terminal domain-containing protein [Paracoccus hibiscisoli]|uniref:M10 family metallopeptidase C-terminal domain-containing protein n=1 Tax=Paracoccus hibiscisoli TaxID=2023261 RepID=UPI001FE4792E|nr:hypothetical protein [Paracoccus hibiscisoli]
MFSNGGDDILFGGEGDDLMVAGGGNDRLRGGEGNDTLNGGAGNDLMTGGEGADRFVFNGGRDRITDFENGDDQIDLSSFAAINSFSNIRAAASQQGSDVVINIGPNSLVIEDFRLSQMNAEDFIW